MLNCDMKAYENDDERECARAKLRAQSAIS